MRIECNRCDCGNKEPIQTNDQWQSIICKNCTEILSYERSGPVKREKSEPGKKERKVEKGKYKKKYDQAILLPSEMQGDNISELYSFEINKIYNEDCFLTMKRMKDKEVDYIFTSPPYNIGASYKKYGDKGEHNQDDMSQNEYLDWSIALIDEMLRVTKNHVFFNIQEFASNRIALDTLWDHYKYKIKEKCIWVKDHGSVATNGQVMNPRWEYIVIFSNQNPLQKNFEDAWFGGRFNNVVQGIKRGKNKDADVNKATFPLGLPRKFIQAFGRHKDLWYDPFMGTGTTARAAILENRRWVGSELAKVIFTRCVKNIKTAQNNPYFDFIDEIEPIEEKKPIVKEVDGLQQIEMNLFEEKQSELPI